jgi:integrase
MAKLRQQNTVGARALHFVILTAARRGEVRGATWDEIDTERAVWAIRTRCPCRTITKRAQLTIRHQASRRRLSAARMKAGREHCVPLSEPTLALLRSMELLRAERCLVFRGRSLAGPLSRYALVKVLRRMAHAHLTAHGWRSSFRDWCADTGKSADAAEAALARTPASKVVAAYARSDLLEQRRSLMQQWADFLTRPTAEVVPLRVTG